MKLPAGEMSSSQQNPPHEEASNGNAAEGVVNGGQQETGGPGNCNPEGNNPSGNEENQFDDYLWMENEEEYDQEVMRQLEEDLLIGTYSEMFENSLMEDGTPGPTTASLCVMNGPVLPHFPPEAVGAPDELEDVTRRFNRSMGFASRLNPNAAEFVPRTSSNVSSPH